MLSYGSDPEVVICGNTPVRYEYACYCNGFMLTSTICLYDIGRTLGDLVVEQQGQDESTEIKRGPRKTE